MDRRYTIAGENMNCALKTIGVKIVRDKETIFENVNLTLTPGKRYCITGRSGTRKTSLIEVLVLIRPST